MAKATEVQQTATEKEASAHLSSQGKLPKKEIEGETKKVIATERGYQGRLIEEGEIFETAKYIEDENGKMVPHTASWFRDFKGGKNASSDEELV